jgi:glycosyltransferase involved in cell wall biosynthesis
LSNQFQSRPKPTRRRPRVLHIGKFYPPQMGGMETHLQALCDGLRQDVDVRVIVSSSGRGHRVHRVNGVQVTRLGTVMTLAGAPICPGMATLIRESAADIVHLHLPNPAAVLAYLASGSRAKLVISYHSDVVRQRTLDAAFRPFLFSTINKASAVIAATPNYIESSPVLGRFRSRCRVLPYGIPLADFDEVPAEVQGLRERFGDRLVVSVGRLVYYKGFDTLLEAMPSVRGNLVIVGTGPMEEALKQKARDLGVNDRVTFAGGVDGVAPYLHAADVFVLASVARSEAFGIVQLEAMACGKPVVNTSLDSGVPYVSRDGESGITVAPKDSAALAGAINTLLDDRDLRERYGREARRRVEREFTQDGMVEGMLRLYEEVLERPLRQGAVPLVHSSEALASSRAG